MHSDRQTIELYRQRLQAAFKGAQGSILIEAVIALTIMGALGATVLMGVRTAHTSGDLVETHSVAETLARNQMEYTFTQAYAIPPGAYVSIADAPGLTFDVDPGYTVTAQALEYTEGDPLIVNDADIEKVIVTVNQGGQSVLVLETLRVRE